MVPPGAAFPSSAARLPGAAGLGPGFGDERRPAPRLFNALRESGPRLSSEDKGGAPTPLYVMASAFTFTLVNGYLQAGALGGPWASAIPGDAAFGGGVLLFLAGALGNAHHDALPAVSRLAGRDGLQNTVSASSSTCRARTTCVR